MQIIDTGKYTIITGKYETGTHEQKSAIAEILGEKELDYKYKIYFHWYNVIHELGHAILHFNKHKPLNDVEEEPIVNNFAVAFWSYYGEDSKFMALNEIVQNAVSRFKCPAPVGMDYMTYAKENWGKEELFTFNNYGWFQFSCVLDSLNNQKPLSTMLQTMTNNVILMQPKQILSYDISDDELPLKIVKDASSILRNWGVTLPTLPHLMVNDPFRHGISTAGY
jgi:hypothetical protein